MCVKKKTRKMRSVSNLPKRKGMREERRVDDTSSECNDSCAITKRVVSFNGTTDDAAQIPPTSAAQEGLK